MKFLYFYRVPVPDPRADAVQIINTCAGIARSGGDVKLHVETLAVSSAAECLAFYGLAAPSSGNSGALEISAIGTHWSWPLFDWKVSGILRRHAGGQGALFVREVRPYVPGLMAKARAAGLKVIFEAHNVSALLVQEKHGKIASGSAPAPYTFSLVTPEGKTALKLAGESPAHDDDHGHGHDDHEDDDAAHATHGAPPPNLDETPAPPPQPGVEASAARKLRLKAEQRAQLEASIVAQADGLICTQKATLAGLAHLLKPGTPTTVLGNGANLPPARTIAKDIDVLYCGSLKPWKGVDTLVAAMQTLYPWKLTIVGPGTREDIDRVRQAALAVGVIERVKILPPVRPAEVWDLYARARVGVIPLPDAAYVEARNFTSPLKLFEMMAAGLPIVCSRLKSLQEYVSDGRDALMVTADDPRPLAEGLRRILTDDSLRNGIAAAALARAGEFTWDARGRKIAEFASGLFV